MVSINSKVSQATVDTAADGSPVCPNASAPSYAEYIRDKNVVRLHDVENGKFVEKNVKHISVNAGDTKPKTEVSSKTKSEDKSKALKCIVAMVIILGILISVIVVGLYFKKTDRISDKLRKA